MKNDSKDTLNNVIIGVANAIVMVREKEHSEYNDGKLQAYCHVLSLSGCSHERIKDITGIELEDN